MFSCSDCYGFLPYKRNREEDDVADSYERRPLVQYVEELVELYYLRPSRIECVQNREKGLDFCSLEETYPPLAKELGATIHHYQLLADDHVPLSFAMSNVPIKAPKRPFIASVLAVVIQACLFKHRGVHVSVSAFDRWFGLNDVVRYPISRSWLDAKKHVAKCIAGRTGVVGFGQEVIEPQYGYSRRLHPLLERVLWIVHISVGCGVPPEHPLTHGDSFGGLTSCFLQVYPDFSASKGSFVWRIWESAVLSLDIFTATSSQNKEGVREELFACGVKYCYQLVMLITTFLRGEFDDTGNWTDGVSGIIHSGTAGEFAAVCLFWGMRRAIREHFSGKPFNRLYIRRSTEFVSRLFFLLISYYICLSPTKRHYLLLDACEVLCQKFEARRSSDVNGDPVVPKQNESRIFILQEDVLLGSSEEVNGFLSLQTRDGTQFIPCGNLSITGLLSGLNSLAVCTDEQHSGNIVDEGECDEDFCTRDKQTQWFDECTLRSCAEEQSFTGWHVLSLPSDTDDDIHFLCQFIREKPDCEAKMLVSDAVFASASTM